MNDTQTLELQLKATGEEAIKVLEKLNTSINNINKPLQDATSKVNKLSNSFKSLFSVIGAKRFTMKTKEFFDEAVNRAEELNLFNVIFKNIEKNGEKTFSDLGLKATRFQYKLNEAFGTNLTETLRYQGLFQAMATNVGIDDKYASIMSENMTKLTYDLASLYNKNEKTTAEALRGGVFAGQTKPLRAFGLDVTQTSLNPILAELGINDRTINQMSQAEKQILRYISTLKQARSAMGDFAETIESPANQLKILRQQITELKVAWGNLFMGMYANILPYVNAIVMVLKELAKAIADMFGIQARDYNTGLASTEEIYEGISDGANNATKATKELKRQILSFDEIHNLTTPTNTGSGSGSGSGIGGIDQRLLDGIKGYDNLMDKVRMKAVEIRDRWMEILGFEKVINPLTGEVSFKYQGLATTIKNIVDWFGDLNAKAKFFIGLGLFAVFTKIAKSVKNLTGNMGIGKLLQSSKSLLNYAQLGVRVNGNLTSGLKEGIQAWRQQQGIIGKNTNALSRFTSGAREFTKGIGIAVVGFSVMNIGLEDMRKKGLSAFNAITTLGGGLTTVFGGIQAGATFGPIGATIGGISSAILVLTQSMGGLQYAFDESKRNFLALQQEVDDGYDEMIKSSQRLSEYFSEADSTFDYYKRLYDELTNIVDENGKIKQGYEDRAKYITSELSKALGIEVNIVDGVIQKYGKLKTSIADLIEQKKAMAKINALEEEYQNALKNQGDAEDNKRKSYLELKNAYKEFNDMLPDHIKNLGLSNEELANFLIYGEKSAKIQEILNDKYSEAGTSLLGMKNLYNTDFLKDAIKNYEKASNTLDGYNSIIANWEKVTGMALKNNYKGINDYFEHEQYLFGKNTSERETYWNNVITKNKDFLEILEKDRDKYSEAEYEAKKNEYNNNIKLAESYLDKLKLVTNTKNNEISNDVIEAWKKIGNDSSKEFLYFFDQLPTDAKQSLIDGLEKNKKGLSKDLQKIINEIKPTLTIDVKGNMSPFEQNVRNLASKYKNLLPTGVVDRLLDSYFKAKGGVFNGTTWKNIPQYANGGVPSHGTLFTAGENGAEIVGNINRRTEVLNRSQIASTIYNAVVSAMSQYSGGTTQVELFAHTDEGVVIDRINQKTKQTGVCPINIPA